MIGDQCIFFHFFLSIATRNLIDSTFRYFFSYQWNLLLQCLNKSINFVFGTNNIVKIIRKKSFQTSNLSDGICLFHSNHLVVYEKKTIKMKSWNNRSNHKIGVHEECAGTIAGWFDRQVNRSSGVSSDPSHASYCTSSFSKVSTL